MDTLGVRVAQALSGSWRALPPPPSLSAEAWQDVAPALHATAASGLAWWRVRGSLLESTPEALACRDAYRLQALDARVHQDRLARALHIFGAAGIRPVLAKGSVLAGLYPRPGLRPSGDVDLHVSPEEYPATQALLREHLTECPRVDLHRGLPLLGRPWAELAARTEERDIGPVRVRVLAAEDHLALLCVHLLAHGAWRPLWLCDVALFLEQLPADFDWDYLRTLPSRQVEEVRLVAVLAHRLLDAELDRTPWGSEERIPGWLPRATLEAWGRAGHYSLTTRIALTEADPSRFLHAVRIRWPNAIEATARWRAPYNSVPRLPYQILDAAVRGARALVGAPPVLARRRSLTVDEGED